MTDKERILAEIDMLKRCTMDEHMKFYCESAEAEYNVLSKVELFINSLQEEPVSEDLEKAASQYPSVIRTISPQWESELENAFKAGAKWGKNQAKVEIQAQSMALPHGCPKEEPVSNDLEEVAQKAYPKDIHKQSIFIHGATYAYTHFKNTQLLDEGLEEAATKYAQDKYLPVQTAQSFKAGAEWQKENLWKPADGDDLPEVDREVIALVEENEHYKVVFAHRPPEYWDGKNILTGKVTRYEPKRYDKGGWNMPNIKYWLDVDLPKMEEQQ